MEKNTGVTVVPEWSDIFGNSKSPASNSDSNSSENGGPQQLIRQAPPSCMRPTVVKATSPPLTANDASVDALGRGLKNVSVHLQQEADFDI